MGVGFTKSWAASMRVSHGILACKRSNEVSCERHM
jgi:hypothetical protein